MSAFVQGDGERTTVRRYTGWDGGLTFATAPGWPWFGRVAQITRIDSIEPGSHYRTAVGRFREPLAVSDCCDLRRGAADCAAQAVPSPLRVQRTRCGGRGAVVGCSPPVAAALIKYTSHGGCAPENHGNSPISPG